MYAFKNIYDYSISPGDPERTCSHMEPHGDIPLEGKNTFISPRTQRVFWPFTLADRWRDIVSVYTEGFLSPIADKWRDKVSYLLRIGVNGRNSLLKQWVDITGIIHKSEKKSTRRSKARHLTGINAETGEDPK